jgi:DNA-binding ferritin-like protein (Dps family)
MLQTWQHRSSIHIKDLVTHGLLTEWKQQDIFQGTIDFILNEDYTESGIAAVLGGDGIYYFCQTFGGRDETWPGFGAFNTDNLTTYLKSFLTRSDIVNTDDFLNVYVTQKIAGV